MSRILYFCPDFPQPSGGTKTLYRHVWRLRQLGFEAAIVHQRRGFVLTWHGYEVPILWLEDHPQFGQADICIFPEVMLDFIRQTQGFRGQRVVIALSWAPAYNRLRPGERWQDYAVIALQTVERLAAEVGVADRLHLWPDKSLGSVGVANRMPKPREYLRWLRHSWSRISEWPK